MLIIWCRCIVNLRLQYDRIATFSVLLPQVSRIPSNDYLQHESGERYCQWVATGIYSRGRPTAHALPVCKWMNEQMNGRRHIHSTVAKWTMLLYLLVDWMRSSRADETSSVRDVASVLTLPIHSYSGPDLVKASAAYINWSRCCPLLTSTQPLDWLNAAPILSSMDNQSNYINTDMLVIVNAGDEKSQICIYKTVVVRNGNYAHSLTNIKLKFYTFMCY